MGLELDRCGDDGGAVDGAFDLDHVADGELIEAGEVLEDSLGGDDDLDGAHAGLEGEAVGGEFGDQASKGILFAPTVIVGNSREGPAEKDFIVTVEPLHLANVLHRCQLLGKRVFVIKVLQPQTGLTHGIGGDETRLEAVDDDPVLVAWDQTARPGFEHLLGGAVALHLGDTSHADSGHVLEDDPLLIIGVSFPRVAHLDEASLQNEGVRGVGHGGRNEVGNPGKLIGNGWKLRAGRLQLENRPALCVGEHLPQHHIVHRHGVLGGGIKTEELCRHLSLQRSIDLCLFLDLHPAPARGCTDWREGRNGLGRRCCALRVPCLPHHAAGVSGSGESSYEESNHDPESNGVAFHHPFLPFV